MEDKQRYMAVLILSEGKRKCKKKESSASRCQTQVPAFMSRTNCLCFERKSSQDSFENQAWPFQSSRSNFSTRRSPGWNLSLVRRPWSSSSISYRSQNSAKEIARGRMIFVGEAGAEPGALSARDGANVGGYGGYSEYGKDGG